MRTPRPYSVEAPAPAPAPPAFAPAATATKPDGKASAGTLLPEDSKKKQIFSLVDLQAGDDAFYNVPTLLEGGEAAALPLAPSC